MRVRAAESPKLNDEQTNNVDSMLAFAKATPIEEASVVLDFDHLVTNKNMRNILGNNIPVSDLPFLKVRKSKSQKLKENPEPATLKGKEKVLEGPKKHKDPKEAPKTVKKLFADAQQIRAKQEAKAKKAAKMKAAKVMAAEEREVKLKAVEGTAKKLKAAEEKAARLKAAEKSVENSEAAEERMVKVKSATKRPQSPNKPKEESAKKTQRMEAARSYLRLIVSGSAVRGISTLTEPLLMIISEDSLRSTEKEVAPQHPTKGGVPVLRDENVPGTHAAGQDGNLPSIIGSEAVQTATLVINLDLPESSTVQVDVEVETREVTLPEAIVEVSKDAGSLGIRVEVNSAAAGPSNWPSVCPVADEARSSSSRPFVKLRTETTRPTIGSTHDSIGFFRPAREYEYDEASLEESLAGLVMDAVQALILDNYLGQSTASCIPTKDMIASLVRL
jgi:hypothetical protein